MGSARRFRHNLCTKCRNRAAIPSGMTILSDALDLLRRPLRSTAPTRGRKPDPALPGPVTEEELIAALDRVRAERTGAEAVLAEAAARRERLLMDPDSDDLIHAAARDLNAANLLLERLDRVEPDLWTRLREVQHDARRAQWIVARDAYLVAVQPFAAALAEFETTHRPALDAARSALLAEFASAAGRYAPGDDPGHPSGAVVPVPPLPPPGAVAAYQRELERMAVTLHDPDPAPLPPVLRQATPEEHRQMFGAGPVDVGQEALLRDRYGKPRVGASSGGAAS